MSHGGKKKKNRIAKESLVEECNRSSLEGRLNRVQGVGWADRPWWNACQRDLFQHGGRHAGESCICSPNSESRCRSGQDNTTPTGGCQGSVAAAHMFRSPSTTDTRLPPRTMLFNISVLLICPTPVPPRPWKSMDVVTPLQFCRSLRQYQKSSWNPGRTAVTRWKMARNRSRKWKRKRGWVGKKNRVHAASLRADSS